MKNVLIDTCSWADLLRDDVNNTPLDNLILWVENDHIKLVTHEEILIEWNNVKERQKNKFRQIIRDRYKQANQVLKNDYSIRLNYEPQYQNILRQISAIDKLLKSALLLKSSIEVKAESSDRAINRTAPFHVKIASHRDSYIILSAIEYFNSLGEDFLFVSANHTDFSDPSSKANRIHPELESKCTDISINYYDKIGNVIDNLKRELPVHTEPLSASDVSIEQEFKIDQSAPIFDQLESYLNLRGEHLTFTPTNILASHYPFKSANTSISYYSSFTVFTDNEELFNSVEKLNSFFSEKNSNSLDSKLRERVEKVLIILRENLIYNLRLQNGTGNKSITIASLERDKGESALWSLERFRFKEAFDMLSLYETTSSDLMELSYAHYLVGNYISSEGVLREVYKRAFKEEKRTLAYLAEHNRFRLSSFIRNNFSANSRELAYELKEINIHRLFDLLSTNENKKVLEFVRDKNYYVSAFEEIQALVEKIINHHNSSLRGGWSSNNYVWDLINEYAEVDNFLYENYVIYSKFKQFSDLSHLFFEGVLASHSISPSHSSRLEFFDDWLVHRMLIHGDPDRITKLLKKYELDSISYKQSSQTGVSFYDLIENFFCTNDDLIATFEDHSESGNRFFWDYYNSVFSNILVVVSFVQTPKSYTNSFAKTLLSFLNRDNKIRRFNFKWVSLFIRKKKNELSKSNLKSFFTLGLKSRKLQSSQYFDSLAEAFSLRSLKFSLSKKQFDQMIEIAFGLGENNTTEDQIIMFLGIFRLIKKEEFRYTISEKLKKALDNSFDVDLFYISTIFELIDFKQDYFDQALYRVKPKFGQSIRDFLEEERGERRLNQFEDIVNLCFKFNVDTKAAKFNEFSDYSKYYCWLLDMDGFNYDYFEPNWIVRYNTRFYLKRIYQAKRVRKRVEKELETSFDTKLERSYINIYVRKGWEG